MSYTTLPKSALRLLSPSNGSSDWADSFDYNMTRLNSTLIKLNALLDVDIVGLINGDVLRYDTASSKWKRWHPNVPPV